MNIDDQPDGEWSEQKQNEFNQTLHQLLADPHLYELYPHKESPSGFKLKETKDRRKGLTYFQLCVKWKRSQHAAQNFASPRCRSAVTAMRRRSGDRSQRRRLC